ncbi:phosphonate ABC transporter ATP-binding protein [Magnetospirillum gryphiswaldense]|nr:phosphonate ABC transporter ATP-binding protein [Magnetospirillum gryphiswaldense]AVM72627.1 Phosphate-import ATP-binding protein PhnC [Magnetospirillum gryphiswaldense MSR-1]AVM76530.1 Phosphate-import ATP-binding protein PhnC [Magnetospirillum gryphiswaldense]
MTKAAKVMVPAIKVTRLHKTFNCCKALDGVSLDINPGEMVALIGASGSGKSTLLRHVAGLAVSDAGPQGGSIEVLGRPVQACGRLAADIRSTRARVGFVFQQFNLVGRLPVMTNVLTGSLGRLPLWRSLSGLFPLEDRERAFDALTRVGIPETAWQRASTLSGGQQQRAAIARTLVQRAQIILADEPIASLDPESSRRVMETLATINAEDKTTVVVCLHQVDFAIRYCPRTIALKKGVVVYDGPSAALTPALLRDLYGAQAEELGAGIQGSASFVTGETAALAAAAS